jgi:hypothetical protein
MRNRIAPGAVEHAPGFLDRDLPDGEHVLVGALIESAEVSIAEVLAERHGIEGANALEIYHGTLRRGHFDAGQSRPRKVLHPRSVRRDRVDRLHLRPRQRRVPPVVEDHSALCMIRSPLLRELLDRAISTVAIHDEDAAKAAVRHAVEDVAHDVKVRLHPKRDRAGECNRP